MFCHLMREVPEVRTCNLYSMFFIVSLYTGEEWYVLFAVIFAWCICEIVLIHYDEAVVIINLTMFWLILMCGMFFFYFYYLTVCTYTICTDKMYFTTWDHNYIYTPGHDFKVDRYEWNKCLPGKTEKLSSKLVLRPVHFQHESYYCCCTLYVIPI